MEVVPNLIGGHDPDLFGQMRIERRRDAQHRQPVFKFEIRYLPERVDAGVGTAGAGDVDLLAGDSADRLLNLSLNGAAAALPCAGWCRGKALPA